MLVGGATHFRVLAPVYESDVRARKSGLRTRLHSGATVAGKEVGGTSPVKAVVLALISIGDQRNVLNGGDPGKRALRCGASVNLTTGHAGRASQDARMVRGTCQGELQRGRAEGEPIMKKLMIAVLAVALAKRGP